MNSSNLLSTGQKAQALVTDVEHARFFESAGSRAIYCIGQHGTYLQFVGAHPKQAADLASYLAKADADTRCFLITSIGYEAIKRDQVEIAAGQRTYHVVGNNVIDNTGECIASGISITVDPSGAMVAFEAGQAFSATPSNLSALRQIALYEAQSISLGCEVHTMKIGLSNVTVPKSYRGPLKSIGQQTICRI
ncbi:hypothetical protein V8Z74_14770 [Comamonas sp. w2-DMI]|uniref:hypothetical protein n=1 Tax=Comamonas sp. w2-DMI TaxID=3126391 RepID=UPI0032E4BB79